jgi:hypothetical protein
MFEPGAEPMRPVFLDFAGAALHMCAQRQRRYCPALDQGLREASSLERDPAFIIIRYSSDSPSHAGRLKTLRHARDRPCRPLPYAKSARRRMLERT